ncbi:MAG: hypothetical protein ABIF17_05250 [Patescibacteria group bacterium]
MTDINLLSYDKRAKDLKEKELNLKERDKVNFDLKKPAEETQETPVLLGSKFKKISLLARFKEWRRKLKEKKEKRKADKAQKKIQQEKEHIKHEIKPVLKPEAPLVEKPKIKNKEDLFHKIDLSDKKINQYMTKERMKYTYGEKIEDGFDVNLMPGKKQILEISTKIKMIILLLVLVGSLGFWVALFFWFDFQVNNEMQNVSSFDERIEDLNENIKGIQDGQKNALVFQNRMEVLSRLMSQHAYVSRVFEYLETNVTPGVYFETIDVDVINERLNIDCMARDYTEAAKQILVFEEDSKNILMVNIADLDLNDKNSSVVSGIDEEKPEKFVKFSLGLVLSSNFFNH